ncbi:MAG: amidophosphoribosyltransferase [Peptococcaceae bacterium]|jgi:amidophosphoribosyltransferase|nr:amidophosphoribosyltransferase [Peptococcaceae bacterium]
MNESERWSDKPEESCGVVGIAGVQAAASYVWYALQALQHRGQESAGIATVKGDDMVVAKGMGLVSEAISLSRVRGISGDMAIGHVRYSTVGASSLENAQPLSGKYLRGSLALAHNGQLLNTDAIRRKMMLEGALFQAQTDSEVLTHLLARPGFGSIEEAMAQAMTELKGSYSLVALDMDRIVAARDPYGNKPLCLGAFKGGWAVASESCVLDVLDARWIRDVEPGEIVTLTPSGIRSVQGVKAERLALCAFEYVYFARPDSVIDGVSVMESRNRMGRILYEEYPVDADVVIPVPDSGIAGALGYAHASGISFDMGLVKNRFVGRTFIKPSQAERLQAVQLKLSVCGSSVEGKKVVLVDDSIVRGTTSRQLIRMVRAHGAKEVHLMVASPPVSYPCYYGIDTASSSELIAATHTRKAIREFIDADSVCHLSLTGLRKSIGESVGVCAACFDGSYPLGFKE